MIPFTEEFSIYARHVLALCLPNRSARVHTADANEGADITSWPEPDQEIMVEEGRRQLDRQHDDLERIRGRAQFLLALGVTQIGAIAALQGSVAEADCFFLTAVWILALLFGAWATLGAAVTASVQAEMNIIHTAVLSKRSPPILAELAQDYASMLVQGQNQLATRLTNFRLAIGYLLLSGILGLVSWLLSGP